MNPITREHVKLVMQPSFRAVGQKATEWQAFELLENKRQMYGSQSTQALLSYICLLFSGHAVNNKKKRLREGRVAKVVLVIWTASGYSQGKQGISGGCFWLL